MKRTRRQYALIAGFAAALTLIGLSEWLNTRIAGRLREAAAAVAHTHEVQTSLSRLLSLLQEIETGAHGYVVTGEPAFLEPFDTAVGGVASQFRTLCTLTRDNAIQGEHCKALEAPITERIAEAQASVNLRRASGFEAARERMATRTGKAAMDRIRAVVGRMNAEEETLLGQHSATAAGETRNAKQLAVASAAASALLLVGLFALILREQRLRQRAQRQRERFFELSLDMLSIAGTDGRFRQISPSFSRTLGWSTEELLARPFIDLVHPEDRAATLARIAKLGLGVATTVSENRYRCKDGSWKWLSWKSITVPEEGLLYSAARDVTDAKAAADALRASEENLGVTLQSIGDGVLSTDAEGRITRLNAVAEALTGWTQAEASGLPVAEVFHIINEESRQPAFIPVGDTLSSGTIHGLANHTVLIARDGTERPIADSCAPIRGGDGRVVGAVLVFRDVAEESRLSRALREANAFLESVIENIPNMVFIKDAAELRFRRFNRAGESLLGYSRDHLLGRSDHDLFPPEEADFFIATDREVLNSGKLLDIPEETIHHRDGSARTLHTRKIPLFDDSGRPQYLLGISEDVTERKLAEASIHALNDALREGTVDLERARSQAQQANEAKSAFLAAMSHEIRTPMNGVIGMLDVLHQTSLKGHQLEMVDLIRESAVSLLTIIEDILDFSKIEAGKLQVERAPLALAQLVEKSCLLLDSLSQRKDVELTVFADPAIPALVLGDSLRLGQVLLNLVNNAIKFSGGREHGRVAVRALLAEHGAQQVVVEFRIADNGIGMDEATRTRLFAPFSQGDISTTRRFGGTGLGLAISGRLVELMGGTITVQSEPDHGSVFSVRMPFEAAPPDPAAARAISAVAGLSCVVVGGTAGLAEDLGVYLRHGGATVERVPDLAGAVERARTGPPGPAVWVIDAAGAAPSRDELQAMVSSGRKADARFVVIGRGTRRLPHRTADDVVMVDGNVLDRRTLFKAVAIAAGRAQDEEPPARDGRSARTVTPPSRDEALRQGRLCLVAEDNETNQKVIQHQFGLLGFAADVVADGREALQRWRNGNYGLVLTDLHMPEMDGYELATAIRSEERGLRRTPIIALSANALKDEAQRCRDLGMDDYLSKPARLESLNDMLEKWLPAATPALAMPAVEPSSADAPATTPKPVDVSVLEALVGNDPTLIGNFLREFRASAARTAAELRIAGATSDTTRTGVIAHRLKAAARSIGALALGDLCGKLEQAGKAGPPEAHAALLREFEIELAAVDASLAALLRSGPQTD